MAENKQQFDNPTYEHSLYDASAEGKPDYEKSVCALYEANEFDLINAQLDDDDEPRYAAQPGGESYGGLPYDAVSIDAASTDPLYDSVRRVELDSVDVSCKQGDVILGDNQMKNTLTGDNSYWTSRTPRSNDARNGHANGAANGAANGVDSDGANGHVNIFREHHEDGKKSPHKVKFIQESRCPWRRILVIGAVLVLLAALGYLIYFLITRDSGKKDLNTESNSIDGQFRILNADYHPDLQSETSTHYQQYTEQFLEQMNKSYADSRLSDIYLNTTIIRYSSGSVVVDFQSVFKDLYKTSDLENYVKEALGLSDKNFQFGPFAIDGSSSSVKATEIDLIDYQVHGGSTPSLILGNGTPPPQPNQPPTPSPATTPTPPPYVETTRRTSTSDGGTPGTPTTSTQPPRTTKDAGGGAHAGGTPAPSGATVTLVRGLKPSEGLVLVSTNGQVGTICGDHFGVEEAQVICRMLGYGPNEVSSVSVYPGRPVGDESMPILLDNVVCLGNEDSILDCRHYGVGVHNCDHSEDVNVACQGTTQTDPPTLSPSATPQGNLAMPAVIVSADGRIRLTDGRLEYKSSTNYWGTVCSIHFDLHAADVACTQLGMRGVTSYSSGRRPNLDNLPVTLQHIRCDGSENMLDNCIVNQWREDMCTHDDDVTIRCDIPEYPYEMFLDDGTSETNPSAGVFQIRLAQGGPVIDVCDHQFTTEDAQIVCQNLGFNDDPSLVTDEVYGRPDTVPLRVSCEQGGLCDDIESWQQMECSRDRLVRIDCAPRQIRLTGGVIKLQGRVEVLGAAGEWGTVCGTTTPEATAQVVCSQLGYNGVSGIIHGIPQSSRNVAMSAVSCSGEENSIQDCSYSTDVTDCSHDNDVLVSCAYHQAMPDMVSARLVDGTSVSNGRLEIHYLGGWGSICDQEFTTVDADVACKQLGYEEVDPIILPPGTFVSGSGEIWMTNVQCLGSESYLIECAHQALGKHNCEHSQDVMLSCGPYGGGLANNQTPSPASRDNVDNTHESTLSPPPPVRTTKGDAGAAAPGSNDESTTTGSTPTPPAPVRTTKGDAGAAAPGSNDESTTTRSTPTPPAPVRTTKGDAGAAAPGSNDEPTTTRSTPTPPAPVRTTKGDAGAAAPGSNDEPTTTRSTPSPPAPVRTTKGDAGAAAPGSNDEPTTTRSTPSPPAPVRTTKGDAGAAAPGSNDEPTTTRSTPTPPAPVRTTKGDAGAAAPGSNDEPTTTRSTPSPPAPVRTTKGDAGAAAPGSNDESTTTRSTPAPPAPVRTTKGDAGAAAPGSNDESTTTRSTPTPPAPVRTTKGDAGAAAPGSNDESTTTRSTPAPPAPVRTTKGDAGAAAPGSNDESTTTRSTPTPPAPVHTTKGDAGAAAPGSNNESTTTRSTPTPPASVRTTKGDAGAAAPGSNDESTTTRSTPAPPTPVRTTKGDAGAAAPGSNDESTTTRRTPTPPTSVRTTEPSTSTAGTPSTTPVVDICEDVTIQQCRQFVNRTMVQSGTNPFNLPDQTAIAAQLEEYSILMAVNCHEDLRHFLCSLFLPKCEGTVIRKPCRSYCEAVQSQCGPLLRMFGFAWPNEMNCSIERNFPRDGYPCEAEPRA